MAKLFANVAHWFGIHSENELPGLNKGQRESLPANFGAIVLNGLFFPTAGKILGVGLLLAWFMDELRASTFLIGLLVPIQYGAALLAQPWIGQWMSGKPLRVPYYRNQALLRGLVWLAMAAIVWLSDARSPAFILSLFFAVVIVDAVAAGSETSPSVTRWRRRFQRSCVAGHAAGAACAVRLLPEQPAFSLRCSFRRKVD